VRRRLGGSLGGGECMLCGGWRANYYSMHSLRGLLSTDSGGTTLYPPYNRSVCIDYQHRSLLSPEKRLLR